MLARQLALAATLLLSAHHALAAQVSLRTAGQEFVDAASDIVYTGTAPFRASGRDWLAAATFAGGFLLLLPTDDNADAWIAKHQGTELFHVVKPFRQSNKIGSKLGADSRLLPLAGIAVGTGLIINNRTLRDLGYGCLTTSVVSSALRSTIYAGVSRTRPVIANGDQFDVEFPGGEWNVHSFFSGHSMNAFGCVTYINSRYDLGFAEPALYAVAAAISAARMADRYHWSTDVYAGTVAGIAVGRTVARRAMRREKTASEPSTGSLLGGFQASPSLGGITLSWQRSF